jgi:NAD(P)-dependent dehydrogenase (short-subunit alcohol dehydrogenase family)
MNSATCIVFGGSSGIGEATAKKLALSGSRVIIVGRDQKRLEQARERIGAKVEIASVDATDRNAVEFFFKKTGSFEHLVLSLSGGKGAGLFKTLDLTDIRSGMDGKFFAQLSVAQCALNNLKDSGSITFISAGSARVAIPGTIGLAAINGAIETVVPVLAKEIAPIRVNAVSPGVIDTPWWNRFPKEARDSMFEQTSKKLPVRRVGSPDDVAQAIVFLIGNTFVTGTIIEVDGGAHLD